MCMACTPFIDAHDGAQKRLSARKADMRRIHVVVHVPALDAIERRRASARADLECRLLRELRHALYRALIPLSWFDDRRIINDSCDRASARTLECARGNGFPRK
jgi:hypothetical protein